MTAASSPQDSMLSRWHTAVAARSARISASGPWQANGDSTSPTRAAAFLFRPRFFGSKLRRLLLVLGAVLLLSVCLLQLSGQGKSQLLAVPDGIRHLPWGTSPQGAAEEKAKKEGEAAAAAAEAAAAEGGEVFDTAATTRLPHVPAKIWQIYLDFKPTVVSVAYLASWLAHSPSYSYTLLDAGGALSVVNRLVNMATANGGSWRVPLYPDTFRQDATAASQIEMADLTFAADALQQYNAMPRRVLRADFLRYLVLALEGGVYSDMDTALVKPIRDWVPEAFRSETRLIVGLEADSSPPVTGTTYEVQFCQWTLASSPDHPTLWTMLDRIMAKVRTLKGGVLADKLSDTDVLEITGPAAWTEVVFEHLNQVAGSGVGQERITWQTLTGMKEPQLYGDTLVLPIDGFATGVPHSHASKSKSKQTLIKHQFQGNWREDKG